MYYTFLFVIKIQLSLLLSLFLSLIIEKKNKISKF